MTLTFIFFSSLIIFIIGLIGVILSHSRKSLIGILISIELAFVSVNLSFFIFSCMMDDFLGYLFVLLILAIAASESALGLALLILFFRIKGDASLVFIPENESIKRSSYFNNFFSKDNLTLTGQKFLKK